jgi:hypothetical protein
MAAVLGKGDSRAASHRHPAYASSATDKNKRAREPEAARQRMMADYDRLHNRTRGSGSLIGSILLVL